MSLAIHLLVKNNEKTIGKTLQSLLPLNCEIFVGDLGSEDDTLKICRKYNTKLVELAWDMDYSKAKNSLLNASDSNWIMFIEPWEIVVSGHAKIKMLDGDGTLATCYSIQILQGKMITKEVRIWHRQTALQFVNPVHEHVEVVCSNMLPVIVYSKENPDIKYKMKIIDRWMIDSPTSHKPHYYKACNLLTMGNYDEFLNEANHYLFQENQGKSVVMMKYYVATTQLYVKKNANIALDQILPCLAVRPLMAEFWCLLADIYYKQKDYKRARSFYNNALILGGKRLGNDDWPMDLSKYKDHPQEMIQSCQSILEGTKIVSSR